MAKQGMKRPDVTHVKPKNEAAAVPELSGKAKHTNKRANPIIAGTDAPSLKVYHGKPHAKPAQPVSDVYPDIEQDLKKP